jgi:histidine ammonia-lyase
LGATRDAIACARRVVDVEINSATDNPLVFPETEACLSDSNFHGQPISLAMDLLGIALTMGWQYF